MTVARSPDAAASPVATDSTGDAVTVGSAPDAAARPLAEAVTVLEGLYAKGDAAPETVIGLSLALRTQSVLLHNTARLFFVQ